MEEKNTEKRKFDNISLQDECSSKIIHVSSYIFGDEIIKECGVFKATKLVQSVLIPYKIIALQCNIKELK